MSFKVSSQEPCASCVYTYSSVLVCVLYTKSFHGSQDGGEALKGVAIDHRFKLLYIISGEPIFVDNPDANTRHRKAIIDTP